MHYLIASCDADHDVSRRGESFLKRRCTWETNRPQVDLESDAIVAKLYRAFLGGAESVPEPSRALPASPAMKLRLVSLMCRSVSAANAFPSTVQTIFTCLYGQGTTTRLKASGMELAVWVLRHATDAQLEKAAPLLLDGMLKLLDGDQHKTEEANAAARSPPRRRTRLHRRRRALPLRRPAPSRFAGSATRPWVSWRRGGARS